MDLSTLTSKAIRLLAGAAFLGLGAFVAGCAVTEMSPEAKAEPKAAAPAVAAPDVAAPSHPVRAPRQDALGLRTSFADIVEPALESVVSIEALSKPRPQRANPHAPFGLPSPYEMPGQDQPDDSFGSGVIVRADGVILTNNHVVDGADEVRVRFFDDREMRAKVLGTDPLTDVAVIKVDAKGLPALPLGTSADLRVGDLVFAIGNPFTLSQSVTMGIVSATGRSKLGITGGGYENFIQTDAPINPGNSGGALVDSRGEVIGINTAIYSGGSRANAGIGFAVPIDMVRGVMDQILTDGKVVRAQLGVQIKQVDATLAKSYGLDRPMGALVVNVEKASPADEAGLKPEDLIVELDGKGVQNDSQLRLAISSRKPGSKVDLAVLREKDGRMAKQEMQATLRELKPEASDDEEDKGSVDDANNALRGIVVDDVADLTPAQRRRLSISDLTGGVLVTEVDPMSPAARAGMQPGDVITSINQVEVTDAAQFRALARNVGKGIVRLHVQRKDSKDIVALEP